MVDGLMVDSLKVESLKVESLKVESLNILDGCGGGRQMSKTTTKPSMSKETKYVKTCE